MCSSTVSETANRLRKTRKKKSSAVPLFRSGRRSPVFAGLSSKGKVGVQRGRETAGVPSFLPLRRAPQRPAVRRRRIPPLRFSEKLPARKGRTRLRQFVCPGFPAQKRSRPVRANMLAQFAHPGFPVQKRSRPVRANPLTQFVCPAQPVQKTSLVFKLNCFSDNATAKRHTQAETA